ncbi:hypothetical protein GGS26DRAFT_564203 [Hypomontagnella submonticulosa]|nr:hypothetical protein GGS26DRAFT_564203 [Hypomontagnella submonticulosa]
MMSGKLLAQIHSQLQAAREQPDLDFGGLLTVILSGDFYQFEPVLGSSLLYPGAATSVATLQETGEKFQVKSDEQYIGHKLWLKFTSVILLDQHSKFIFISNYINKDS